VNIAPLLFVIGAVTYAVHPEGVVEFQKRRWLARVSRLMHAYDIRHGRGTAVVLDSGGQPAATPVVPVSSGGGVNA
jgi:hypothetical protein